MMLPKICGGFLNVTQKCNLACKYCFVKQKPMEMTYETAKDAVDFYARNSLDEVTVPMVTFFGGEPLLRYDDIVMPIVEYVRETYGDYSLSITTNGTLLDEERLKFFKDNGVDILLSIDGDKPTQDRLRTKHDGSGSFDDIPIDLYLKYYPQGTFRATLDPRNVRDMYDNYLFAEGEGYKSVTMIPNVFEEWTSEDYEAMERGVDQIMDHIAEAKASGKPYAVFSEFEKRKDDFLNKTDKRGKVRDLPACGTCGIGASVYGSIGPSGDIYSCQEMTENTQYKDFIIGNIYTGVDDERRMELSKKFHVDNIKSSEDGRCERCTVKHLCTGACTINNFFKTGSLETVPETCCRWYEIVCNANERTV